MNLCPHFGRCGGCQIQNLDYNKQLEYKVNKLITLFNKEPEKIYSSPIINYYRNRMDYFIGLKCIGLKEFGKWWSCVDIKECILQSRESNIIRNKLRDIILKYNLEGWNNRENKGILRYLVIREGKFTNQRMVNIILYKIDDYYKKAIDEFYNEIKDLVNSFYISINNKISDVSYGDYLFYYGDKYIYEEINNYKFYILPNSFFQPNSYTAKIMANIIKDNIDDKKIVYDLYSGSGLFSINVSEKSEKVISIEINSESIDLLKKNIEENNIDNIEYYNKKVEDINNIDGDVIIVDPPRPGLSKSVIKKIIESNSRYLIYVSCYPETQNRDIKTLEKYGFKLDRYYVIDQFPHTIHVEDIAILYR